MKALYVGAAAGTDREALTAAREVLSARFGLPVRETELPGVDFAFDPRRNQYGSSAVLAMLARLCPPDAARLVGLSERDLFIPVLTFVFGHAQLRGRVAVVSLARLRQEFYGLEPNRDVFLDRVRKEVLHETGHTFGLVHCGDRSCAMALSTRVQQIDEKQAAFCPACARQLEHGVTA